LVFVSFRLRVWYAFHHAPSPARSHNEGHVVDGTGFAGEIVIVAASRFALVWMTRGSTLLNVVVSGLMLVAPEPALTAVENSCYGLQNYFRLGYDDFQDDHRAHNLGWICHFSASSGHDVYQREYLRRMSHSAQTVGMYIVAAKLEVAL